MARVVSELDVRGVLDARSLGAPVVGGGGWGGRVVRRTTCRQRPSRSPGVTPLNSSPTDDSPRRRLTDFSLGHPLRTGRRDGGTDAVPFGHQAANTPQPRARSSPPPPPLQLDSRLITLSILRLNSIEAVCDVFVLVAAVVVADMPSVFVICICLFLR